MVSLDTLLMLLYSNCRLQRKVAGMELPWQKAQKLLHQLSPIEIQAGGGTTKVYRFRDVLTLALQCGLLGFPAVSVWCEKVPGPGGAEIPHWVCQAEALFRLDDGSTVTFAAVGDASAENTNRHVAKAGPRMAETRAKARALSQALGLDANLLEEYGGDDDATQRSTAPATQPSGARCSLCGAPMSPKSAEYSMRVRGTLVCYQCAKAGRA
jgi:hypothetical protein